MYHTIFCRCGIITAKNAVAAMRVLSLAQHHILPAWRRRRRGGRPHRNGKTTNRRRSCSINAAAKQAATLRCRMASAYGKTRRAGDVALILFWPALINALALFAIFGNAVGAAHLGVWRRALASQPSAASQHRWQSNNIFKINGAGGAASSFGGIFQNRNNNAALSGI
ncbi:hypothetical protein AVEN_226630-1, partial [Araneus ventricosus]